MNEFEEADVEEKVPEVFAQEDNKELISSGSVGTVYDWSTAPQRTKAPPRIDLNGKTVTIVKADIVLPSIETPWDKTRDKKKDVKYCTFVLYYDIDSQQEFYSGVRVFKRDDGKYSHPTITPDGQNQASQLMSLYAKFKAKNVGEVSLREFMGFLNSKPKAVIRSVEVRNPTTNAIVKKNLVEKFL